MVHKDSDSDENLGPNWEFRKYGPRKHSHNYTELSFDLGLFCLQKNIYLRKVVLPYTFGDKIDYSLFVGGNFWVIWSNLIGELVCNWHVIFFV